MNSKRSWSFLVVGAGAGAVGGVHDDPASEGGASGHQVRIHRAACSQLKPAPRGSRSRGSTRIPRSTRPVQEAIIQPVTSGTTRNRKSRRRTSTDSPTSVRHPGEAWPSSSSSSTRTAPTYAAPGGPHRLAAATPILRTITMDSAGPPIGHDQARRDQLVSVRGRRGGGTQAHGLPDRPILASASTVASAAATSRPPRSGSRGDAENVMEAWSSWQPSVSRHGPRAWRSRPELHKEERKMNRSRTVWLVLLTLFCTIAIASPALHSEAQHRVHPWVTTSAGCSRVSTIAA